MDTCILIKPFKKYTFKRSITITNNQTRIWGKQSFNYTKTYRLTTANPKGKIKKVACDRIEDFKFIGGGKSEIN